jgi:hypothetical protein
MALLGWLEACAPPDKEYPHHDEYSLHQHDRGGSH